jgi:UDP-glucose 4-epimerase
VLRQIACRSNSYAERQAIPGFFGIFFWSFLHFRVFIMAVLITGGTGFVGLNLAEALLERGEWAVLFDLRPPPPQFIAAVGSAASRVDSVIGDVLEPKDIERAFARNDITHVFHGAVITSGADREVVDPNRIVDVNLGGTLNVLRAARDARVRRFLFPSSLAVYGQSMFDRDAMNETDTPPVPESLYAVTKYAAERAALRLADLWEMDVVVGRIGNVFGPWEGETGARDLITPLAQVAAAAVRGQSVVLPDIRPRRELIYSRDLARALLLLLYAERPGFATYNLGVSGNWSDIYTRWCRIVEARSEGFKWHVAAPGEAATINYHDTRDRARLDVGRLQTDLGFAPAFPRDLALQDYIEWLLSSKQFFQ